MADYDYNSSSRQRATKRLAALKSERESYFTHWRDIRDVLLPRSGAFMCNEGEDRGRKRNQNIYDSTATHSVRTLGAGLLAGLTSPARPWFRLRTPDKKLNAFQPVKVWLSDTADMMREIFYHSNTYRALRKCYESAGGFGTCADLLFDDFDDVVRHYPCQTGEFLIACDERGKVNTLYREIERSAEQTIREFGKKNVSSMVATAYDEGNGYSHMVKILHAIEPRAERDMNKRDAKNMPFRSCYYELGRESDPRTLRESGFKRFPGIVARWDIEGIEPYGSNCPGMEALGDIKQLQHQQLRKGQGIDYQTRPAIQVPTSLKNQGINGLPGGVTYNDSPNPNGIKPMWEVNLNLGDLREDIMDVRQRIRQCFFEDLFLMLANDDRSNVTAREVSERHEEKMLMLGPVLENLHDEMLKPLIDQTFDRMVAAGLVPPPPDELHGMPLNVQFVSVLAQAQHAIGLSSVDRLLGTVGVIAQHKPEILDKIDADKVVDTYADMLGVDPELIVANDKVALIRDQRAKQQAAMQAAATAPAMADTAKTLGDTNAEQLGDVVRRFSGYTTG